MPDATDILAQWEAICEAATKGPWTVEGDGDGGDWPEVVVSEVPRREITNVEWTTEAEVFGNCHFIVAARTGWPAAIRALEEVYEFLAITAKGSDLSALAHRALKERITAILEGRDAT